LDSLRNVEDEKADYAASFSDPTYSVVGPEGGAGSAREEEDRIKKKTLTIL
jgi:hypothetical protein